MRDLTRTTRVLTTVPVSVLAAQRRQGYKTATRNVGVWLSLVEHLVRDEGVAGSNPATPTNT